MKAREFKAHDCSLSRGASGTDFTMPPGEGTGPTIHADCGENLVGRVPSRGKQEVIEPAAAPSHEESPIRAEPVPLLGGVRGEYAVGTSRCDVRAACSGATPSIAVSRGYPLRRLLRGRGRRSAPSLPSRQTGTDGGEGASMAAVPPVCDNKPT